MDNWRSYLPLDDDERLKDIPNDYAIQDPLTGFWLAVEDGLTFWVAGAADRWHGTLTDAIGYCQDLVTSSQMDEFDVVQTATGSVGHMRAE